jgi:hypothetical protein
MGAKDIPEEEGLTKDIVVVDAVFDGLHVGLPACGASLEIDVGVCGIAGLDINDGAVD